MHKFWVAAGALALASCGERELSPAEQAELDEEAIAQVEAAQKPPPAPLSPQAIRYPDIERHEIYGASCAFVPDGGGVGAIAIAMREAGYMKLEGDIERFAPDPGSSELPLGTRSKYVGGAWSFQLELTGDASQTGSETFEHRARFTVRNDRDQIAYEAEGLAQCGT